MKNMLSVHEFSDFSGLSRGALRHWDEIGLLVPQKRDPETNYRYYSPDQIIAARFISFMRGLDVPLKTILDIHHKRNPIKITRFLEEQRKLLDKEMDRLRENYTVINTHLEMIKHGTLLTEGFHALDGVRIEADDATEGSQWVDRYAISVLYQEEQSFIFGPPNEGQNLDALANFCIHADAMRINLAFPLGAYTESMEAFRKAPNQHKCFISLDPRGNQKRPAGEYLVGTSCGEPKKFMDMAERMSAYAEEHLLETQGPVYTLYLHDELCAKEASEFLIHVSVAVSRKDSRKRKR